MGTKRHESIARRLSGLRASAGAAWPGQAGELVASPGVEIIASDAAARLITQHAVEEISALPRLGGQAGAYAAAVLAPFRFDDITVSPPTRTFAGRLSVDVGGREVELIEVGPAHTAGDVLVHVPDARVMFARDILFIDGTPIVWAGPPQRWVARVTCFWTCRSHAAPNCAPATSSVPAPSPPDACSSTTPRTPNHSGADFNQETKSTWPSNNSATYANASSPAPSRYPSAPASDYQHHRPCTQAHTRSSLTHITKEPGIMTATTETIDITVVSGPTSPGTASDWELNTTGP